MSVFMSDGILDGDIDDYPDLCAVYYKNAHKTYDLNLVGYVEQKETPEALVFTANLPGLRKEEIKVEVEGNKILQIRGERNRENRQEDDGGERNRENRKGSDDGDRYYGKFLRRFTLPGNANLSRLKAVIEDGSLVVTVPKKKVRKPRVKTIEISGDFA